MTRHLNTEQTSAAIAGLDLEAGAQEHLASCFLCRQQVSAVERLISERRDHMRGNEPDWEAQCERILSALPATVSVEPLRPRSWLRPLLAAAAVVLLGVVVGFLHLSNGEPEQQAVALEQILAEVEATLAEDALPGFEALDPIVPSSEDVESLLTNGAS